MHTCGDGAPSPLPASGKSLEIGARGGDRREGSRRAPRCGDGDCGPAPRPACPPRLLQTGGRTRGDGVGVRRRRSQSPRRQGWRWTERAAVRFAVSPPRAHVTGRANVAAEGREVSPARSRRAVQSRAECPVSLEDPHLPKYRAQACWPKVHPAPLPPETGLQGTGPRPRGLLAVWGPRPGVSCIVGPFDFFPGTGPAGSS